MAAGSRLATPDLDDRNISKTTFANCLEFKKILPELSHVYCIYCKVDLAQGWPTFLVKGQNYLKNDFKGHFSPQKLKLNKSLYLLFCPKVLKSLDLYQLD